MDKDTLRATQGPALIALKARGAVDDTAIACKVQGGRALAIAGLMISGP
jgi:hypothetical protein